MRALYGDTLSCTYSVNGSAETGSFTYMFSDTIPSVTGTNLDNNNVASSAVGFEDYEFLVYRCQFSSYSSFTQGGKYVEGISIPALSTYFSNYARGGVAISSTLVSLSGVNSSYNAISTHPDNYYGSFHAVCADTNVSQSLADYYGAFTYGVPYDATHTYSAFFRFIPYYVSNFGTYLDSCNFDFVRLFNEGNSTYCAYLIIICPYVGGTVSSSPPTTTTTTDSGSGGTTINVNIDMDETNTLLDRIKSGIDNLGQSFVNALKSVFIPDDDFMDDFKEFFLGTEDEPGFLEEHLGCLYQVIDSITRIFEEFPEVAAKQSITIPAANIPLAGETFTIGGWTVPLKVDGLPALLYDGIAWITDFLCTAAFLNMCRNKLEIFLNPETEVIKE